MSEEPLIQSGARLLEQIALGDQDAFACFYDQHSGLLFAVVFRILQDQRESEDVLQEAFLQIWDKAGNYNAQLGNPLSWAVAITRHKAIDRLRSLQRRGRLLEEAREETGEAVAAQTPSVHGMEQEETARAIRTVLQELPAEQRQAIELAFFSGLTQKEIAVQLQEPLGTVKARVRRGMMKLREILEQSGFLLESNGPSFGGRQE